MYARPQCAFSVDNLEPLRNDYEKRQIAEAREQCATDVVSVFVGVRLGSTYIRAPIYTRWVIRRSGSIGSTIVCRFTPRNTSQVMNTTQLRLARERVRTITELFHAYVKAPASCKAKTIRVVAARIKILPKRSTFRIAPHGDNRLPRPTLGGHIKSRTPSDTQPNGTLRNAVSGGLRAKSDEVILDPKYPSPSKLGRDDSPQNRSKNK